MLSFNKLLEINNHTENIINLLKDHPVLNIVSGGASGKSTVLPVNISKTNNVFVAVSDPSSFPSQPNINYVSKQDIIDRMSEVIRKTGCLDVDLSGILIIDEADSGSLDDFMIMILWRYCAERGGKVPKLIMLSKTPVDKWYGILFDITTYYVPTIDRNIEIRYSEDDLMELIYNIHTSSAKGDMLLFVSDKSDIPLMTKHIDDLLIPNLDIIGLNNIHEITKGRKLIITDRSGETQSLNNNIGIVIDLMMDKTTDRSLTGGLRHTTKYITKEQADVRANRGTLDNTLVYRMINPTIYLTLDNHRIPEIYKVPLHLTMLDLYEKKLNPFDILNMFPESSLKYNYGLMLNLGVIDMKNRVTEIGKFAKMVPLGLRNAVALYRYIKNSNDIYSAIIILTMIDSIKDTYFQYPLREDDTTHIEQTYDTLFRYKEYFLPFEGRSDVETYGNIWNIMLEEIGPEYGMKDWCENNYINHSIMSEVSSVSNNIINLFNDRNIMVEEGTFDVLGVMETLGPILADIYKDRQYNIDHTTEIKIRYMDNDLNYYKMDSQYCVNSIDRDRPETVYGLITSTIRSEYSSDFNTIICSLVILSR